MSKSRSKPKTTEEAQYKRLLRENTPPKSTYAKYLRAVTRFGASCVELANSGAESWKQIPVQEFNVVKSELFGHDYLVGYDDPGWLASIAPGCDAIATPEIRIGRLASPPLVLVPSAKRRTKTTAFRSVIEHEFAHVNQAILGRFPDSAGFAKKVIPTLSAHTWAEYEANFIQLFRWPQLFEEPRRLGVPFDDWCALRGYTQALEKLVAVIFEGKLSPDQVAHFLRDCPKKLPGEFRRMGINEAHGHRFAAQLTDHLAIAVTQMINAGMRPKSPSEGFNYLAKWIKDAISPGTGGNN